MLLPGWFYTATQPFKKLMVQQDSIFPFSEQQKNVYNKLKMYTKQENLTTIQEV